MPLYNLTLNPLTEEQITWLRENGYSPNNYDYLGPIGKQHTTGQECSKYATYVRELCRDEVVFVVDGSEPLFIISLASQIQAPFSYLAGKRFMGADDQQTWQDERRLGEKPRWLCWDEGQHLFKIL